MKKLICSLLFLGLLTALCTGLARAAAAPAVTVSAAQIDGRELVEVFIRGRVVMRIGSPGGGLSPMARANTVAERLTSLISSGARPGQVNFKQVDGLWAVTARDQVVVTVDERAAQVRGSEPKDLAFTWAGNIRVALGGEPLAALDYWLPGGTAEVARTEYGVASWYGPGFHGRQTANGETFEQQALTAAHRTLPFGTQVLVTNLANGRSVLVKINDRGPWVGGRVIDLSKGAALALDLIDSGLGRVRLDIVR